MSTIAHDTREAAVRRRRCELLLVDADELEAEGTSDSEHIHEIIHANRD